MSRVEVVAAVSAVVSAFHAGSELLKHIKAKRRKSRAQAQQDFEEKQLQDSLASGEQQVGYRYTQDVREMGDVVRVGDTIAYQRLMHVVVILQGEIIKSLQMAVQHETAILNLRLLHEASIMNRKDTFVILDEMKQRIILMRPIPRPIKGTEQRSPVATLPSSWPSNLRPVDMVPDGYTPSAVTLPSPTELKETKSGLARYFQMKRSSSAGSKPASISAKTPKGTPKIDYCAALEQMAQAKGQNHATVMKDIDEIVVPYKGLEVNNRAIDQPWKDSSCNHQHPNPSPERRGTLDMLNGNETQQTDMVPQFWTTTPAGHHVQPLPYSHTGHLPMFNQDVFNASSQHSLYSESSQYSPYSGSNPYPHHQTYMPHRFSNSSMSSIPYSDTSWERNGSESSHSSYAQSDPRCSISPPPNKPGFPFPTSPSAQQINDHYGQLSPGSGSIGILPRSSSSSIPSSTIRSPIPGQERMMNGRPCKANDYWGFCKGAWDVREDAMKGLALRTMPSGMYNTKEVWECRSCNFRGNTYIITTGKKGKKETIIDPNIHTSESGIRYRWIFLAKSHVKKKTTDSTSEDCNYGCMICSVELKVTSIFGNVDTLMYHLLEHVSGMSQKSMVQTKCIVGRTAGAHEEWDVNVPLFAEVSEVEG
ncbi:uncharacterized protein M421DRAFT_1593 [Didymella exigua CBS 183.55]|uniref:C2H2-type domain-containing protein n=1 Tax=Didymella exigua CBS 183.55 TaxID=1150837 RepID=A0A6A5S0N0_9PLEO|nr:uncharacterized protein M421DRAFT_1593 [Didymella exigua CBS 183.55]KAF1933024.1 hypothetical protein M421DRAFT_1593 [Didymella exigua CBS 183.55]